MALAEGAALAASAVAEKLAALLKAAHTIQARQGDKLWLTTADGSMTVSVPRQAQELSCHLGRQFQSLGLGESVVKPIVLPQQVGRETLSRLVTYLDFHCAAGAAAHSTEERNAFDASFVRVGVKRLFELTSAAQSLEMAGLLSLCIDVLDDPGSSGGASCSSSPTAAAAAAVRAAAQAPAAVGVISAASAPLTHVISRATRSTAQTAPLPPSTAGPNPALWPPVSQAQRTAIYHAALSAAASCGTVDYIWLATSDAATVVSVHKKAAELSPFILRHLFSTSSGFTEADPILVPQQVGAATLKRLALYFNYHGAPGLSDKERKVFDERFVRLDTKRLCELMSAADGLEMRQLVEFSSRALVKVIQGKTPEEIREALNMPDDLTEEEKLEPVPGDPDDARIRLLNRLYAKKRKELQGKKQEEPQAQQQPPAQPQDRVPLQDTRSLDELLLFIGGEEDKAEAGKGASAAAAASKKKKKKPAGQRDAGAANRTESDQQRQQDPPSVSREPSCSGADQGADASSSQAGPGTSAGTGHVTAAGPERPSGSASAGATANCAGPGPSGESSTCYKAHQQGRDQGDASTSTTTQSPAVSSAGPNRAVEGAALRNDTPLVVPAVTAGKKAGKLRGQAAGALSAGKDAQGATRASAGKQPDSTSSSAAAAAAQAPSVLLPAVPTEVTKTANGKAPGASGGAARSRALSTPATSTSVPVHCTPSSLVATKPASGRATGVQGAPPVASVSKPTSNVAVPAVAAAPAPPGPPASSSRGASSRAGDVQVGVQPASVAQQQQQQVPPPPPQLQPTSLQQQPVAALSGVQGSGKAHPSASLPVGLQHQPHGPGSPAAAAANSTGLPPQFLGAASRGGSSPLTSAVDQGDQHFGLRLPALQPGLAVDARPHVPAWSQQEEVGSNWAQWAQQLSPAGQHLQQQLPQWEGWGSLAGSQTQGIAQQRQQASWPGMAAGGVWGQQLQPGKVTDKPQRPRTRLSALPVLEVDPDDGSM